MKRTPLRRHTPLRRTGGLRRTRLNSVNPERQAERRERDFGPLADYVRGLGCCACGASAPSDPAHVKSRGAGGHAFLDNGDGNLAPFCRACHGLQHLKGWSAITWTAGRLRKQFDAEGSKEMAAAWAKDIGEQFTALTGHGDTE